MYEKYIESFKKFINSNQHHPERVSYALLNLKKEATKDLIKLTETSDVVTDEMRFIASIIKDDLLLKVIKYTLSTDDFIKTLGIISMDDKRRSTNE